MRQDGLFEQSALKGVQEALSIGKNTMNAIADETIEAAVQRLFVKAEQDRALELVLRYGKDPKDKDADRVRRAILKLSHGDIHRLNRLVNSAKQDYEDVLWWAEEEEEGE